MVARPAGQLSATSGPKLMSSAETQPSTKAATANQAAQIEALQEAISRVIRGKQQVIHDFLETGETYHQFALRLSKNEEIRALADRYRTYARQRYSLRHRSSISPPPAILG